MNAHYINRSENVTIINNTTIINNSRTDNSRHTTYNAGPERTDVEKHVGRPITPVVLKDRSSKGQSEGNGELAIYRPRVENTVIGGHKPAPAKVVEMKDAKSTIGKKSETKMETKQPDKASPAIQSAKRQQTSPQQHNPSQNAGQLNRQQQTPQVRQSQQNHPASPAQTQHNNPPARQSAPQPQHNNPPARQSAPQPQHNNQPTRQSAPQPQHNNPPARQAPPQPQHNNQPERQTRPEQHNEQPAQAPQEEKRGR